ncbi:MAG TPA: amidohydrolase [Lachnospiraceae bacterium]|nr:amidohydrolase [Lachnospiraceae bacterium]
MDNTEKRITELIDQHRQEIIDFGNDIYDHAELGYKEFRTSERFAGFIKSLGLKVQEGLAITGAKGYLNRDKKDNFSLALIGELDALRIPQHAHANPETQAAHCCGHHTQLAGVIGAAIALSDKEVADRLDGQAVFFAVPAEEYGEVEFKNSLKAEGKIKYGGGKCELIRIGAFDDIDAALAHHTSERRGVSFGGSGTGSSTCNGFVSKVIRYKGRAAHAAGAPDKGINALNAATLGLQALAMNRETFRDEDCVRIHPIMTKGGDLVNVVPDEAVIETLVRARTLEAVEEASAKTDRAFRAGAEAIGAGIRIETMPGYLPSVKQDVPEVLASVPKELVDEDRINTVPADSHVAGSTDVGDVQHLMPVMAFQTGGIRGGLHQADFEIVDEDEAYILTAKIFALSAYRLLRDGAAEGRKLVDAYEPRFRNKEEYTAFMDRYDRAEENGIYREL